VSDRIPIPSLWSRLWRWLKHGRMGGGRGWSIYLSAGPPKWWQMPRQIWLALARRRRIIPSPLLYLAVAAVGVLIGVVLQVTVGVWWWLPPLALLIVAWLVFLSSIWWPPRTRHDSLRVALLSAVNPRRGFEARRREQRELVLASGLPLFELESWPGTVRVAGWGGPPERITRVSVGFCAAPDSTPIVSVTTIADQAEHEDRIREQLLDELSGRDLEIRTGPLPSPEAIRDAIAQARDELRALSWAPVTIRIDGRDHEGFAFRGPQGSAAYCALGDLWVTIAAAGRADYPLRTLGEPDRIFDTA